MSDNKDMHVQEVRSEADGRFALAAAEAGRCEVKPKREKCRHDDAIAWMLVQALHANVPEDKRPMSWSDLSIEQCERIRAAARSVAAAAIARAEAAEAKCEELREVLRVAVEAMLAAPYSSRRLDVAIDEATKLLEEP
jgi:hypothetical protein